MSDDFDASKILKQIKDEIEAKQKGVDLVGEQISEILESSGLSFYIAIACDLITDGKKVRQYIRHISDTNDSLLEDVGVRAISKIDDIARFKRAKQKVSELIHASE